MIVIGKTTKGYWPAAVGGKIPGGGDQIVGYPSHPFGFKMNTDYIVALAQTFEERYGVKFEGMEKGPVTDTKERLLQFKTNMDVAMSVLDRNGLGDWLADRLVELGDMVKDDFPLRINVKVRSAVACCKVWPGSTGNGSSEARNSRRLGSNSGTSCSFSFSSRRCKRGPIALVMCSRSLA